MRIPMRTIGTITVHQIRRLVIDPATYVWLYTMPLLITYVLGLSLNSLFEPQFRPVQPYRVGVIAQSEALGAAVSSRLENLPDVFTVRRYDNESQMRTDLADKRITALVTIPPDPHAEPVRIVSTPDSIVSQILYQVLRPILDEMTVQQASMVPSVVHVTQTPLSAEAVGETPQAIDSESKAAWADAGSFQYYSLAIAVMFALYAANTAMGFCAGDFSSGAYARMRTYGVSRAVYLFAGYLSSGLMAVLFITVMTLVTKLLFGVHWGTLAAWLPFTLLSGFTSAAVAFLVMSIVPANPRVVDGMGSLVFNIIAFFGGSTAPLGIFPQWLISLTAWLPNRAILEGYLRLAGGTAFTALHREMTIIGVNLLVLLGICLVINTVRPKGDLQ